MDCVYLMFQTVAGNNVKMCNYLRLYHNILLNSNDCILLFL